MFTYISRLVLEPLGQIPEDCFRTFWSPGKSPKDVSVIPDDAENPENIHQPVLVKISSCSSNASQILRS
jgi:hypothetical protein